MVAFVLWEIYMPLKEPLMPLRVVTNREWIISALLTSIGASIYYAFAVVCKSKTQRIMFIHIG